MNDIFRIDTPGVNVEDVVSEVRRRVDEKRRAGVRDTWSHPTLATRETADLKVGEEVFNYYLKTVVSAARIDINDFEIPGENTFFGQAEAGLKKIIWNLLKFYTFRLFSQQNDFNTRVAMILQGMDRKYSRSLEELERKLASIEGTDRG